MDAGVYAEYVLRHRVQTRARKVRPATVTRPICRLGSNLRLTRFFAWLTWCPNCGRLPQISHALAMSYLPLEIKKRAKTTRELGRGPELYHGHLMASKTTTALIQSRQWGRIEVFPSAVAAIAGHAAMRCYGISGMAGRGLRDGVAELLRRENADKGVDVVQVEEGLAIDVYVIVQYGIRITEVAHNLQETVKFEVERSVNVPVLKVNVNVQGVREEEKA